MTGPVNPAGSHVGPWMFGQALDYVMAGGKARRQGQTWVIYMRDGHLVVDYCDGRQRPVVRLVSKIEDSDILAADWEPVS